VLASDEPHLTIEDQPIRIAAGLAIRLHTLGCPEADSISRDIAVEQISVRMPSGPFGELMALPDPLDFRRFKQLRQSRVVFDNWHVLLPIGKWNRVEQPYGVLARAGNLFDR
jgi:hypothetical protein